VLVCANCGQENPEGARFCLRCGQPLAPAGVAAPGRESRKTVTVLFSDVTGSTALGEQLNPESLRRVMGRYFGEMQAVLEAHGGTVEKFIGDAIMAVFGIPVWRFGPGRNGTSARCFEWRAARAKRVVSTARPWSCGNEKATWSR